MNISLSMIHFYDFFVYGTLQSPNILICRVFDDFQLIFILKSKLNRKAENGKADELEEVCCNSNFRSRVKSKAST